MSNIDLLTQYMTTYRQTKTLISHKEVPFHTWCSVSCLGKSVFYDHLCAKYDSTLIKFHLHLLVTMEIPRDQKIKNGGAQPISEILHIEDRIVYCNETYLKHIYLMTKCSQSNRNRYIEGFYMWQVCFDIHWFSWNITHLVTMSWPLTCLSEYIINN